MPGVRALSPGEARLLEVRYAGVPSVDGDLGELVDGRRGRREGHQRAAADGVRRLL